MSEPFIKSALLKIAASLAHLWVWGFFLTRNEMPNWLEITVYNRDVEHKDFEGKKVKITLEVLDE